MLDTKSKPLLVPVSEGSANRTRAPQKASFGLVSLRRHRRLLALGALSFFIIGVLYSALRPMTYTAVSQLLVYNRQIQGGADLAILPGRADLPLVQNQIEFLRSGNVLDKVVEALGLAGDPEFSDGRSPSKSSANASDLARATPEQDEAFSAALDALRRKLSVKQIGTSHMVAVAFKASEPAKAARVVNTVIHVYLQELARAADAVSPKAPSLRELYQSLGPSAFVVSEAQQPIRPDGAPAMLIALGASLFGFGVCAAIAISRDVLNDTIRSAEQVESALGMGCLEVVQSADTTVGDDLGRRRLMLDHRQLRLLTASILEQAIHGERIIGVTSAMPGEGATTIAIGLARAIAASGKAVLLIDGDWEDRSVSRWAAALPGVAARPSKGQRSSMLDGVLEAGAGLHVLPLRAQGDDNTPPLRPAFHDGILESTANAYDLVIIDLPALAVGPDARAMALPVDGFLLVVKWGATASELVREALRSAGAARPKFFGAVLNMAEEDVTTEKHNARYAPLPLMRRAVG
jgi:polysaccharide biosynthesis transport protein